MTFGLVYIKYAILAQLIVVALFRIGIFITPSVNMAEQAGALAEEEQKPRPVKLEYEQVNGMRHAVETLDEGKVGQVAKSKLQVMCASICRDLGVSYSAEDLTSFRDETTSLSCRDFVEYLQEELLPKGKF